MKKNVRNTLVLIGLFVLCLSFSLALLFTGQGVVAETPIRKKEISGTSVNTVSIADVKGVMKMTAFNYLPNEFAELNQVVSGENDGTMPAKRGTYRFYIDTLAADEWADSGNFDSLLKPDGNWHLTMYLPPIFSACSVYVRHTNEAYVGSIDRYNINYYLNFSAPSEFDDSVLHQTATEPMFLDILISSDGKVSKECVVTIHYEADNDNFVGLLGPVLIGEETEVRQAVNGNRSTLLFGTILGAVTFLFFLLICILKRSFSFIPQLLFAVGIFSALFSTYMFFGFTTVPYFLRAIRRFSLGFMLFASALYLPKKIGKVPVLYPACAITVAASVLAFLSLFCTSVAAYMAVCIIYIVLAVISILVSYGCTIRDIYQNKPLGLRLNTMIISVSTIMALFADQPIPFITVSPAFWLYLVEIGITFVLGLREFITAEIRSSYLTTNLEQEVEQQTKTLRDILAERDKILLYASHDMRKIVVGMGDSLTDLRQELNSPELVAKTDLLLRKIKELRQDFAEIGKYGKQNYIAEQSEEVNLTEIVQGVANDLRPDCEANGILLTVTLPETLYVYAKRIALHSVITNLVMNAIEHSFCTHLTVTAIRRKGICRLDIIDDGKGITTNQDVFAPFVSGSHSEHHSGLGLFLAKNAIEAMHGELTYERKENITIFSATLPLA